MNSAKVVAAIVALLAGATIPPALGHPNRHLLQNREYISFTEIADRPYTCCLTELTNLSG
jgi:hypothetical protein